MYGCQQNLISPNHQLKAVLEFICSESNKLTNCGIYYARQIYLKTHKIIGKFDSDSVRSWEKPYDLTESRSKHDT